MSDETSPKGHTPSDGGGQFRPAAEAQAAAARRAGEVAAIADVAATVADEFADILTTVLANVSLARAEVDGVGRAGAMLAEAEAACLEGKAVLRDLLTVAYCSAAPRRPLDTAALARDVVLTAPAEPVLTLSMEPTDGVWQCLADGEQMRCALGNLLAVATTAARGNPLRLNLCNRELAAEEHAGLDAGRYVVLAVTPGCDPCLSAAIPEPSRWRVPTRSGSRLLAAWAIARSHGGQLLAGTASGQATYALYVPAAPA